MCECNEWERWQRTPTHSPRMKAGVAKLIRRRETSRPGCAMPGQKSQSTDNQVVIRTHVRSRPHRFISSLLDAIWPRRQTSRTTRDDWREGKNRKKNGFASMQVQAIYFCLIEYIRTLNNQLLLNVFRGDLALSNVTWCNQIEPDLPKLIQPHQIEQPNIDWHLVTSSSTPSIMESMATSFYLRNCFKSKVKHWTKLQA